uniref:hypothetical protein n=1 Tax=Methanobrevibacter sp. TaxID=66852 RepID=UPI0038907785
MEDFLRKYKYPSSHKQLITIVFEEHVVKMGFLNNLFKPKYKHSDWKIRREAVKEISDEKILIDIAKSDDS